MRAVAMVIVLLGTTRCSYDWTVASVVADTTPDTQDTTVLDTAVVDTTPSDAAPDCAALLAAVASARTAAKRCVSTAGVCTTEVTDECGCKSVVAQPGEDRNRYVNAVSAAAGCKSLACGTCAATKPGFCLVADGGGTACAGP